MTIPSSILTTLFLYYTLFMILRSHQIGYKELFSWNALIIYLMLLVSYCYIRMPIPIVYIATGIFTLKIIQRNPLLRFPSNISYKIQLLVMSYLLFSIVKQILFTSLFFLDNIIRFISIQVL
ncbi:hypothetical protein CPAV1605_32 [seawater metagenome]|uniref:Uncharacterized protein n=1 Tax=seawater metagenome TaxID=1561972 RepID=A0A5E8CL23_9ZZZZ